MTFLFDSRDDEGKTPMHYAVAKGMNESIKNMVNAREQISLSELFNVADDAGISPLLCIKSEETLNVILLLDMKGEIACHIKTSKLLQNAVRQENVEVVSALVSKSFMEDVPDDDGTTSFTSALGTLNIGKL